MLAVAVIATAAGVLYMMPLALGIADMWEATQVIFTGMGPNFWEGEKARQGLMNGSKKFTDPEFIKVWKMMSQFKPFMHPKQSVHPMRFFENHTLWQSSQFVEKNTRNDSSTMYPSYESSVCLA